MNLPNRLTLLRIVLVPVFIACFYLEPILSWWNWLAAGVFFVADMTDVIDGAIARKYDLVTNFGKLMDPIADKLLFCSAFIYLTANGSMSPLVCVIFIAREFIISGFRLIAVMNNRVIAANKLGKIKATIQVIAILFTLTENPVFSWFGIPFDRICMYAAVAFTVWSAADYMIKNWKEVVKSDC